MPPIPKPAEVKPTDHKEFEDSVDKQAETKKDEDDAQLLNLLAEPQGALNNPLRRKRIEARCSVMELADLLVHDELRQQVPIVDDGARRLVVVFRTPNLDEDLFCRRKASHETLSQGEGNFYFMEVLLSVYTLVAALVSINGKAYPEYRVIKSGGEFEINEEAFLVKLGRIRKLPAALISDLSTNYVWFDQRVRGLLSGEKIKNG